MRRHLLPVVVVGSLAVGLVGCTEDISQALNPSSAPAATASRPAAQTGSQPNANASTPNSNAPVLQATAIPADAQSLGPNEQIIADVASRVGPAVVRIDTGTGLGSGWLYQNGYIVTNNHVIDGAQGGRVLVSFSGLFQTVGQVIGTDPDSDIAVVQIEEQPDGVQPLELADSNKIRVGQSTIAIGNPLGQDRTVTTGIVSALGRTIREDETSGYSIGGAIQTDAAINPGNSGGPLLDAQGRLLGMNTAILSRSGTSAGIGFSVPVNLIRKVVPELIESGQYDHPYLGVGMGSPITTYRARTENLPGIGVSASATPGGPMEQADVSGDFILNAINGVEMASADDVISYLEVESNPGDTVTITIFDGSGQRDVQVQVGSRPRTQP